MELTKEQMQARLTAMESLKISQAGDGQDYLFVSFHGLDWELALQQVILPLQQQRGLRVYCDSAFGQDHIAWFSEMKRNLSDSHCKGVICFLSQNYLGSYFSLLELMFNRFREAAMSPLMTQHRKVVPFVLDNLNQWDNIFINGPVGDENTFLPSHGKERELLREMASNMESVAHISGTNVLREYEKKNISDTVSELNRKGQAPYLLKFTNYDMIRYTLALCNAENQFSQNATDIDSLADALEKECPSLFDPNLVGNTENKVSGYASFRGVEDVWAVVERQRRDGDPKETGASPSASGNKEGPFEIVDDCLLRLLKTDMRIVNIPENITKIGAGAFENCKNISTVNIPDGVTIIGEKAFFACHALRRVSMGENVSSIGDYAFCQCGSLASIRLPSSLIHVGDSAFMNCSKLLSMAFPSTLRSLGNSMFTMCLSLESVTLPKNLTHLEHLFFTDCESLKSVNLPDTLEVIDNSAFSNCRSLRSVVIPEGVTTIGKQAFQQCCNLEEITFPSTLRIIGDHAFNCGLASSVSEITLPEDIETIGEGAFDSCIEIKRVAMAKVSDATPLSFFHVEDGVLLGLLDENLLDVTLPPEITAIASGAFANQTNLHSVVIPETVSTIGEGAFSDCSHLHYVKLPQNVSSLPKKCFRNCVSLEEIVIPESATLEEAVFFGCSNLKQVTLPQNLSALPKDCFRNCVSLEEMVIPETATLEEGIFYGCTNLKQVTLPQNLTALPCEIFRKCHNLGNLILPDSVTILADSAFEECLSLTQLPFSPTTSLVELRSLAFAGCSALESAILPETVKIMGSNCFANCPALSRVLLPEGLCKLKSLSFSLCFSLTEITLPATVETVDNSAFDNCPNLKKIIACSLETEFIRGAVSYDTPVVYEKDASLTMTLLPFYRGEMKLKDIETK